MAATLAVRPSTREIGGSITIHKPDPKVNRPILTRVLRVRQLFNPLKVPTNDPAIRAQTSRVGAVVPAQPHSQSPSTSNNERIINVDFPPSAHDSYSAPLRLRDELWGDAPPGLLRSPSPPPFAVLPERDSRR
jgi:hypothetical protein